MAKMTSVRSFLVVATTKGWELVQMDIHNAFLLGDLDEEVYMVMPPGFRASKTNKICKLQNYLNMIL